MGGETLLIALLEWFTLDTSIWENFYGMNLKGGVYGLCELVQVIDFNPDLGSISHIWSCLQ